MAPSICEVPWTVRWVMLSKVFSPPSRHYQQLRLHFLCPPLDGIWEDTKNYAGITNNAVQVCGYWSQMSGLTLDTRYNFVDRRRPTLVDLSDFIIGLGHQMTTIRLLLIFWFKSLTLNNVGGPESWVRAEEDFQKITSHRSSYAAREVSKESCLIRKTEISSCC